MTFWLISSSVFRICVLSLEGFYCNAKPWYAALSFSTNPKKAEEGIIQIVWDKKKKNNY